MAVRATHVETGTDISIGPFMDPTSQAVVDEVYQNCSVGVLECREHDNDPYLAHLRDPVDGRVHGAWVYVQKRRDVRSGEKKYVIAHSKRGIAKGYRSHEVPVGKSDLHQWQQDYICRAAEDVGFPVGQEVTLLSGTRLDVKIDGTVGPVGFEVQHSHLSVPKVRTRTLKASVEGIPLVWCADHKGPDWAFKVPHIEANGSPDGSTPRRRWTVTTGPREISRVKCESRNVDLLPRCQKPRRRNWCGGYHPVFRPIAGLVVDDVAQKVPAGELVPLDTRTKQGVILTTVACFDLWWNEFADRTPFPERERNNARPCGYEPHLQAPRCTGCGQRLLLVRPGRKVCEACRIAQVRAR